MPQPPQPKPWPTHAVVGVVALGAVAPGAAFVFGESEPWMGDHGLFIVLGLSCAAYTFHAFSISTKERTLSQVLAFGLTLMLALLYPAWMIPVNALADMMTVRFEPPVTGQFNGVNAMSPIVAIMMTGSIMALAFWATTRSTSVLITVLVTSAICAVIAAPTGGASAIPWNLAVAISLYKWAAPARRERPYPPLNCPTCGYSLKGLPSTQCPECGQHLPAPPQDPAKTQEPHE